MEERRYPNPREDDRTEVSYCKECRGTGKLELEHWSPGGIELMLAICGACGGSGIRGVGPRGPDQTN